MATLSASDFLAPGIAIIGALGGGWIIKVIDRRYQLKHKELTIGETFQAELMRRISVLTSEIETLKAEANSWREKYFSQRQIDQDRILALEAHNLKLEASIEGLKSLQGFITDMPDGRD